MACFRPFYRADAAHKREIEIELLRNVGVHNQGIFIHRDTYDCIKSDQIRDLFVPIPCGCCSGCVIDYSKQWAARCLLEAKQHEHNYFVTLTYNDVHLPSTAFVDPSSGEFIETQLVKKDFQDFMKRLREILRTEYDIDGVRFLACGEYGSKNGRPHYHVCLLGMPDLTAELELWQIRDGTRLYRSKTIERAWTDPRKYHRGEPMGFVTVGEVTWQSACYVARYVMKKVKNHVKRVDREEWIDYRKRMNANFPDPDRPDVDFDFRQEEFLLMSRRPGLARAYYDEHKNAILESGNVVIPLGEDAKIIKAPKYFDYLYDIEDPDAMEAIKLRRVELAKEAELRRTEATGMDPREYARLCDERQERKNRRLVRI